MVCTSMEYAAGVEDIAAAAEGGGGEADRGFRRVGGEVLPAM